MQGTNVVVTGGAGFIGSSLTEGLSEGSEVTVIDNLSTGAMGNISALVNSGRIRFVEGDISDADLLKKELKGKRYVFHEAAIPSVPRSIKDPLRTNEANVTGTLKLLLAARDCGVEKVIFASSSSVYGDTPTLPKREGMEPRPMSPYALTKLAGEHYCRLFSELYGLKTVALRYFNVYGPRQDPNSEYAAVMPKFISCALTGKPMPIYGDGMQTRDFSFVKDVVRANVLAAESGVTGAFNIAGGKRVSVMELAGIIARECKVELKVEHLPERVGDIRDSLADVTRAKDEFGWAPRYALNEGIREAVEWFRRSAKLEGACGPEGMPK